MKKHYLIAFFCKTEQSKIVTGAGIKALRESFLNPSIDQEDYNFKQTDEGYIIDYYIDLNKDNIKHIKIHTKDLKKHLRIFKKIKDCKIYLEVNDVEE